MHGGRGAAVYQSHVRQTSVWYHRGSRKYQEDRNIVMWQGSALVLAVLDGHGGAQVSEAGKRAIQDIIAADGVIERIGMGVPVRGNAIAQRILREYLNKLMIRVNLAIDDSVSKFTGATCTIAIVFPDLIAVAYCGDSQCFVIDGSTSRVLLASTPHRSQAPAERKRAVALAKSRQAAVSYASPYLYCTKSGQGLAVTRGIGDKGLPFVDDTPDIEFMDREPGKAYILACVTDGVTDAYPKGSFGVDVKKLGESVVSAVVRSAGGTATQTSAAYFVVDSAMASRHWNGDNTTAVVALLG
jgi:serine/threonine protein phosphatase PrpC